MQLPSFDVDPSKFAGRLEERLWKPLLAGQVMLVMFWHSVGESGYCPAGHRKTQQTSLMMVLPGWHGGEVLFVVVVVLQPRVVHDFKDISIGPLLPIAEKVSIEVPIMFEGINFIWFCPTDNPP